MPDHEQGEPALTLDTVGGLTITQAAALLGVHPNTVRKQVKRGELPSQRVLTPQGLIYVIPREALGLPESDPVNLGLTDLQPASSPTTGLTSLVSELSAARAERERLQATIERQAEELGRERALRQVAEERAAGLEGAVRRQQRPWWRRLLG